MLQTETSRQCRAATTMTDVFDDHDIPRPGDLVKWHADGDIGLIVTCRQVKTDHFTIYACDTMWQWEEESVVESRFRMDSLDSDSHPTSAGWSYVSKVPRDNKEKEQ